MNTRKPAHRSPIAICALTFLAGALLGTVLGYFSGGAENLGQLLRETATDHPAMRFILTYILFASFSAAAFLLGTSVIGRKIIPLITFIRGVFLSCSAAWLLCAGSAQVYVLRELALPAFFTVPALFLIAEDGIISSDIICLCSSSGLVRSCDSFNIARMTVSAVLIAAGTAARQLLLPLIT